MQNNDELVAGDSGGNATRPDPLRTTVRRVEPDAAPRPALVRDAGFLGCRIDWKRDRMVADRLGPTRETDQVLAFAGADLEPLRDELWIGDDGKLYPEGHDQALRPLTRALVTALGKLRELERAAAWLPSSGAQEALQELHGLQALEGRIRDAAARIGAWAREAGA